MADTPSFLLSEDMEANFVQRKNGAEHAIQKSTAALFPSLSAQKPHQSYFFIK